MGKEWRMPFGYVKRTIGDGRPCFICGIDTENRIIFEVTLAVGLVKNEHKTVAHQSCAKKLAVMITETAEQS